MTIAEIPESVCFENVTPRIRGLFGQVWAAIPAHERAVIAGRLEGLLGQARPTDGQDCDWVAAADPDGVIVLAEWKLEPDQYALFVLAHELAHVLLHHEDTRDEAHELAMEIEADQKAKDWGFERVDQVPASIKFKNITPRIRRLFSEVWAAIPADERALIAGRLKVVLRAARGADPDPEWRAAYCPSDGTIELAQQRLRNDWYALGAIAHELAHVLLHHDETRDSTHDAEIEDEAEEKAKEWENEWLDRDYRN